MPRDGFATPFAGAGTNQLVGESRDGAPRAGSSSTTLYIVDRTSRSARAISAAGDVVDVDPVHRLLGRRAAAARVEERPAGAIDAAQSENHGVVR